jgi:hypothetical protein
MQVALTDYAIALLQASTGPITLDNYKLGTGVNYIPQASDTDIHGSLVFTGTPSAPSSANANIVKYSVYLDYNTGDFNFGEFGLYIGTNLFALGVATELIAKIKMGLSAGNSIRLDIYLSMVGTNYNMWFDLAESNNQFRVASIQSPDMLPPSADATPNVYIIAGATSQQSPLLAYTDRQGLWNFDVYQYSSILSATVTGFDSHSVTINITDYSDSMVPAYFGQLIIEFITGPIYSICRYIKTTIVSGTSVTLGFNTPLAITPVVGDKFQMFTRSVGSIDLQVPIATASVLGGIKIGTGLQITPDGTCSIDALALGLVTSVNAMVGDVVINATNLPGLSAVGKSGLYSDLIGAPGPYTLPVMSQIIRGGAKLPANGNLVITGTEVLDLGFAPVKKVNGLSPDSSGNVVLAASVIGLINPTAIPTSADLNNYKTTGLFNITAAVSSTLLDAPPIVGSDATLEVVPLTTGGTGDSIQRWTTATDQYWRKSTGSSWSAWQHVGTGNIATTSTLGIIKVGSGLAVAGDGTLSASLPIATTSVAGIVKAGTGLSVAGDGTLTINMSALAVATTSSVGVVKIGTGILVDGAGTISADFSAIPVASATVLGSIKVGNGLAISSGVLSSKVLTVNSALPDGSGNITVPSDATKLNVTNGVATGIRMTFTNIGTIGSGGTVTMTQSAANVQAATFTGGTVTWSMGGWPAANTYAEVQMRLVNAGLATHTFPSGVNWVNPDGSLTTVFATYIGNQRPGFTNFQSSGTDFVVFWTDNGGTTIYGKVM